MHCRRIVGIVFGVIPGLTGTICLVMLVPLTYAMQSMQALVLLTSGILWCCFWRRHQCDYLEHSRDAGGHMYDIRWIPHGPKRTRRKSNRHSSGCFSVRRPYERHHTAFLGPLVADWALAFSSTEYFSLILMGLCCVSGITGKSLTKGFLSMFIGVLISSVGMTPITGDTRFTFGSIYLASRLEFMPIVIGFFAISEFFVRFEEKAKVSGGFEARG